MDQPRRGDNDAAGFSVYVLRDPRDGAVFFVGRSSGKDATPVDVARIGPTAAIAKAHEHAVRDAGYEVEHLIVATNLSGDAEAATVERAVIAAYEAARLVPSNLVAAHRLPGHTSSVDPLLGDDPFDQPDVRQFVAQAAAEIERLFSALSSAEEELAKNAANEFLDPDHRGRLETLILQQESEIAQMNAGLERVRALRDLAQWAARAEGGDDVGGTIRIADLNRALD